VKTLVLLLYFSHLFAIIVGNDVPKSCTNDKCYTVHKSSTKQNEGRIACQRVGGSLASIKNTREKEQLYKLLRDLNTDTSNNYWIGAMRVELNNWQWLDGTLYKS